MRTYEPIWIELKKNGRAALTANPRLHSRIKKAVIKEKDNDLSFKLQCSEDGKKFRLATKSEGRVLSFVLKNALLIHSL